MRILSIFFFFFLRIISAWFKENLVQILPHSRSIDDSRRLRKESNTLRYNVVLYVELLNLKHAGKGITEVREVTYHVFESRFRAMHRYR